MLIECFVHEFDLFYWWAGEVSTVYALTRTVRPGITVEDSASVILKFKSGAIGSITTSWSSKLSGGHFIAGKNGSAELIIGEGLYRRFILHSEGKPPYEEKVTKEVIGTGGIKEIEHFLDCILDDREPLITGEDGKATVEIISAAYRSAETGKPVELPFRD